MVNHTDFPEKKIGLVLGGGGARGLAHIGIIKVLEEAGITISHLAGCSMGGLIASLYASGMPISEIEGIALSLNNTREILKLVDHTPSRKGLLAGKSIRKFLSRFIPTEYTIENTKIPLVLNAVDLNTGREIELREGSLLDSIMATTAVPGFFPAVDRGPYRLVDGGMLDDVPVKYLKSISPIPVVAVDVHLHLQETALAGGSSNHEHIPLPLPVFMQDFYNVEMIMTTTFIKINLEKYPPDLLVRPTIPADISLFFGFLKVRDIIQAGEDAMREKLPILHSLLQLK